MEKSNRRHSLRQYENIPVQVSLEPDSLREGKRREEFIPATLCNSCDEGLYIEIDRAVQPGANVDIKMLSPDQATEKVYFINNGRVIWCKKVTGETHRFGMGIKILREVIRAGVSTSRF